MSEYGRDYYSEEERSGNSVVMFPAAMVVGAAFAPLYYRNPQIFTQFLDWLHETILSFMPEFPEYPTYIMIGLAVFAAYLFRGVLRKFWLLGGLALGVLLWVPFGAHVVHHVPLVKEYFPDVEPNLTLIVARNDLFTTARNWAVETIPLPPSAVPSLSDALAAAQPTEGNTQTE